MACSLSRSILWLSLAMLAMGCSQSRPQEAVEGPAPSKLSDQPGSALGIAGAKQAGTIVRPAATMPELAADAVPIAPNPAVEEAPLPPLPLPLPLPPPPPPPPLPLPPPAVASPPLQPLAATVAASPRPLLPPVIGQDAYAVESVHCEREGAAWVTVLEGTVTTADASRVQLHIARRLGLRYHPYATGIADDDWYCVPRRRYCFSPIGFSDWGGQHHDGELGEFERQATFAASTRLVVGIATLLRERCPQ